MIYMGIEPQLWMKEFEKLTGMPIAAMPPEALFRQCGPFLQAHGQSSIYVIDVGMPMQKSLPLNSFKYLE